MKTIRQTGFVGFSLIAVALFLFALPGVLTAGRLDEPCPAQSATVTVDSSFPGYQIATLTDRKWYAKGEEVGANEVERLGNGHNTWVSGESPSDHWICLEWPQAIALDEIEIWWSLSDWYPRAFRIERDDNGRWAPLGEGEGWMAPTDRQSVITAPKTTTRRLRVFQPAKGANARNTLAAQEIMVFDKKGQPRQPIGVRSVSTKELARMIQKPMVGNIARLDKSLGASMPVRWDDASFQEPFPSLADGNYYNTSIILTNGHSAGVAWPVRHSLGRMVLNLAARRDDFSGLVLEVGDGAGWAPVSAGLKTQVLSGPPRLEWSFEPVVTDAIRVRKTGGPALNIAEIEAFRFMPGNKDTWPARLTEKNGLEDEILAAPEDPSFERLALSAHSMASTRYPVGLKDHPSETGVGWEGSIIGREKIKFSIGVEQYALGEFRDTLRRGLIDGWRPGVVIDAILPELQVRETVFAAPMGSNSSPMVFIRFSILNLARQERKVSVNAEVTGERVGQLVYTNDMVVRGDDAILMPLLPAARGDSDGLIKMTLSIPARGERHFDFIHPQATNTPVGEALACRDVSFGNAQMEFRQYWDKIMASSASFSVPEERINRAVKAVLAQCFVCGDGDMMYYGVVPSVYECGLFGYEESFPMLALALFGYGADAQRYMSATYMTPQVLRKVDEYRPEKVENWDTRHQQYRNGLEPHYAVSLYRLTRDKEWAQKHLPIIKDCAEWTIAQRGRTMALEDGRKPIHWGLLPKWAYGGDVLEVLCHPFFPNYCCWRGLNDTAWLLDELGDAQTAARYRREAREFRAEIDRAVDESYRSTQTPPFLPLKAGGEKPDEMFDFYQLFSGTIFDVEPFASGSKHARWITDYLKESNRLFCGLCRHRPMGPGALDAIYSKGLQLQLLHDGDVRRFLLSFYAYLAFNMEHDTFVSRESNVLYPSDLHQRSPYPAGDITDPLTCGAAVLPHLVRHLLLTEERGEPGEYSGNLLLLPATPRPWLRDGQKIRLRRMPSQFGPVDLEVVSKIGEGRIEASLTPPERNLCKGIKLRLRHPDKKPIKSVTLDGKPWKEFDPEKELILIPVDSTNARKIEAMY